MKKWLEGAVQRASDELAKKAAERAARQAVDGAKKTARDLLERAEEALFGDEKDPGAADGSGAADDAAREGDRGPDRDGAAREAERRAREREAVARAREEAARTAEERTAGEARREAEIDDELAALKKKLGKK